MDNLIRNTEDPKNERIIVISIATIVALIIIFISILLLNPVEWYHQQ